MNGPDVAAVLLGVLLLGASPDRAYYAKSSDGWTLPDPHRTPGAVRTTSREEICSTSTKTVRHTTAAMKREACSRYGPRACAVRVEIDHLVPLEAGGADVAENLWPQPWKEARVKDQAENRAHRMICDHGADVEAIQKQFRDNWTLVEKQ